jgi:hypothetical protein
VIVFSISTLLSTIDGLSALRYFLAMDEKFYNLTPEEQQATVHGITMPNKNLSDNFRDARIRLGLWLKQNMCSAGAEPDYTREAGLEGLREFQKRFNEVLVAALKGP